MPNQTSQHRRPITERQNDDELQELLRAATATHSLAGRIATVRTLVSIVIAAAALIAIFVPASGTAIAVAGALWAVALELGPTNWLSAALDRAATLQEMFDVDLYGLPWNEVQAGKRIEWHEVSRAARHYRGNARRTADYYDIPHLTSPLDIIACQIQNLAWGARVRHRFVQFVVTAMVLWVLGGVAVGLTEQLTISQLMVWWYVPSLAALLVGVDAIRSQRSVIARRRRALDVLQDAVSDGVTAAELEALARKTQDVIFLTRQQVERVPAPLFSRFKEADRADFRATVRDLSQWAPRHSSP